jgi:hypothetical protein
MGNRGLKAEDSEVRLESDRFNSRDKTYDGNMFEIIFRSFKLTHVPNQSTVYCFFP